MKNVLCMEHSHRWSWGFTLRELIKRMFQYKFVKILWQPGRMVDDDLVDHFDITMVQNLDNIKSIKNKSKVVSRIGGFFVDKDNASNRFDLELSQVAAVIATNNKLYEVGKRINKNTFMIPNCVDLDLFKPDPERIFITSKPFVVGFAGNIRGVGMNYKGYKYYVDATIGMYPKVKTFNLLFGHNQIPHEEMPEKFFNKIDCLILPSIDEGCSNTVMEALACGVPVLLTKVCFHGERLEDGLNCLFIKRDINDIIEKITILMNNPSLRKRLSFNGRYFAKGHHDINKMVTEYNKVFNLVLKKGTN